MQIRVVDAQLVDDSDLSFLGAGELAPKRFRGRRAVETGFQNTLLTSDATPAAAVDVD